MDFEDSPTEEGGEQRWEVRFRINDATGRSVGYLSLWPGRGNEHLLIDLRLVAVELLPAFERMLLRSEGGRETTELPAPSEALPPAAGLITGAAISRSATSGPVTPVAGD